MEMIFDMDRKHDIEDLRTIMRILRSEEGCPWDKVQTHESIRQDCLEEAYEVCDAIDREDMDDLKEELGDLLLQVVFHSCIEEEKENFTFDDVCDGVSNKLIHRHPHVFKDREQYIGAEKYDMWESAKREEHDQHSTAEALEGVAHTLPSIWRMSKIIKKARKAGYEETIDLRSDMNKLLDSLESEECKDLEQNYANMMTSLIYSMYDKIDLEKTLQDASDKWIEKVRSWENAQ